MSPVSETQLSRRWYEKADDLKQGSQKSAKLTKECKAHPTMTQGKIDLRNESGRPMKVKVVGEVSEKWN